MTMQERGGRRARPAKKLSNLCRNWGTATRFPICKHFQLIQLVVNGCQLLFKRHFGPRHLLTIKVCAKATMHRQDYKRFVRDLDDAAEWEQNDFVDLTLKTHQKLVNTVCETLAASVNSCLCCVGGPTLPPHLNAALGCDLAPSTGQASLLSTFGSTADGLPKYSVAHFPPRAIA
jgi:hypothetical protein